MTLEDFLKNLDQGLKEYQEEVMIELQAKADSGKKEDASDKKKVEDAGKTFMKYFCYYIMDGTEANKALKQAINILLTDEIFLERLKSCIIYIMAMTSAAILSEREGNKDGK